MKLQFRQNEHFHFLLFQNVSHNRMFRIGQLYSGKSVCLYKKKKIVCVETGRKKKENRRL